MSISWGKTERFKFIAEGNLNNWLPPTLPAVYAITYRQDEQNRPKSHTVLYFGHADDLSRSTNNNSTTVVESWINGGGHAGELQVFIHPMPGSTFVDRMKVCEQLVSEYKPDCN